MSQQTTQYGWQFLYMGADQDAIEVGASLGVPRPLRSPTARQDAARRWAAASGKVGELRAARITAPAAPMPAFTDAERADLAE